jgi:hypothetical protein
MNQRNDEAGLEGEDEIVRRKMEKSYMLLKRLR